MRALLLSLLASMMAATAAVAETAVYHWGGSSPDSGSHQGTAGGAYVWAGTYVGVNGAVGGGSNSFAERGAGGASAAGPFSGVLGGLTLGVNTQIDSIVAGAEADLDASSLKADSLTTAGFNCDANDCRTNLRWLGTMRARLGYEVSDNTMIYATGGLAYGGVTAESGSPFAPLADSNQFGWVVGAGLETALTESLSAKFEALYVNLGRLEISTSCATDCYSDIGFGLARIGVNYRF